MIDWVTEMVVAVVVVAYIVLVVVVIVYINMEYFDAMVHIMCAVVYHIIYHTTVDGVVVVNASMELVVA